MSARNRPEEKLRRRLERAEQACRTVGDVVVLPDGRPRTTMVRWSQSMGRGGRTRIRQVPQ